MPDPFFTVGDEVFTFHTGDIQSIRTRITGSPDTDSFPNSPPSDSMVYDLNGAMKTISITGKLSNNGASALSPGSVVTINEQRQWLEKNLNGFQSGGSFESNYASTWNGSSWIASRMIFSDIEFVEEVGDPNSLAFNITLVVGDT